MRKRRPDLFVTREADPRTHARAWLGIGLHWAAEISVLYGALRACGVELGIGERIIAYAAGYVATRRSLTLGRAGVTEALMTYALYWVHVPLALAPAAVGIYRGFNFLVVAAPGVISYRRLLKLMREWDRAAVQTFPATPGVSSKPPPASAIAKIQQWRDLCRS